MQSPQASKVRLKVHHVTVAYDGISVLRDFSLEVQPGDFVAVLGPNGSGKTTLLRTLLGYLKPRAGAALVAHEEGPEVGIQSLGSRERARLLAAVRQDEETSFDFTVEDMVLMGRTPHLPATGLFKQSDIESAEAAMRQTQVLHLRDRLVTELSGGERRRVMIARALAQQPRVLLLDEPTSNLDLKYQGEMLSLVKRLNEAEGITVITAMHEINLAASAAQTMVLMNQNGQIHSMGNPTLVLTKENIEAVYGVRVLIIQHPDSGKPQVLLGS